ncbi:MAG: hypothetical protein KF866_07840 [Phycisphaeraceae bacterium]|nr:hypothetical protein [Phycisphaeraceae bacterium]MCW5753788.1 hypothetical protein [Phycisphaeraceae bacterium]
MFLRAVPVVLLAALAGNASAAITGISSNLDVTWLNSPPASVAPGALVGSLPFVFDEQQNVFVNNLFVNVINNPSVTPGTSFPGLLTAPVDSHFFHIDTQSGFTGSGTVFFSGRILGVIYRDNELDSTDIMLGNNTTLYPTGFNNRGWSPLAPGGMFSINNNAFHFSFFNPAGVFGFDQIRILTEIVPSPGTASLLALGGLVAVGRRRKS